MILQRLTVANFGQYLGRHQVDLSPPDEARPVILFGGLNGAGKTTLLDAIQLVLYGKRARLAKRSGGSYPEYLRGAIHRHADRMEGASIELVFTHRSDGDEHRYRVVRRWRSTGKGIAEAVDVEVDGRPDRVVSDAWDERVEQFMPAGLAHLLLFDGEQIADLADLSKSRDVLRTGLYSLLGLDLADQLIQDLVVLERRTRAKATEETEGIEYSAAQAAVEEAQQTVDVAAQEVGAAQVEHDEADKRRRDFEQRFEAAGGRRFEQRAQLERAARQAKERVKLCERHLVELAAGAAPLLMVPDLLTSVATQAGVEERTREAGLLRSVLGEHDRHVADRLVAAGVDQAALTAFQAYSQQEQDRLRSEAASEVHLQLSERGQVAVAGLVGDGLRQARRELRRLVSQYEDAAMRLADLDRQLAAVPDDAALASLLEERAGVLDHVEAAAAKLRVCNERLVRARADRDAAQDRRAKLLARRVEADFEDEDRGRLLSFSARSRELIVDFRAAVLRKHLDRIRDLMLDSFHALLHKEGLITDIQIAPETLELRLFGKDSAEIPADQLAAGERQILAVALLWGLARASGRSLPTVIDTPLGRLDSQHRGRLVTEYFPRASHQVVLLSTDEEIDAAQYELLRPHIGRQYRLEFDSSTASTRVVPGYFWSAEA